MLSKVVLLAMIALQLGYSCAAQSSSSAYRRTFSLAPSKAPAVAPAPGPSGTYCYTALDVLQASGQYSTLLNLLDNTDLGNLLDDPRRFITVFAPTNAGIEDTLDALGTNLTQFARSSAVTNVLDYHLLPSPVLVTALQNGNSFNTMLRQNNQVQTISINRTMNHLSVQGAFSNANITNTGTQACGSVVYSLDGLLIPSISLSFLSSSG